MTANRISEIFGVRLTRKLRGKLATVIEQIDHGHHVFRANFKNGVLRQSEKFSRFPRKQAPLRAARQQPIPSQTRSEPPTNSKLEATYHKADKAIVTMCFRDRSPTR